MRVVSKAIFAPEDSQQQATSRKKPGTLLPALTAYETEFKAMKIVLEKLHDTIPTRREGTNKKNETVESPA